MNLIAHFSEMARNNAWSNRRLHAACAKLRQEELDAPRTSFFPSLTATLNHILVVDWYYLDGLEGGGRGLETQRNPVPFPRLAELAAAQRAADARLVRFCDALEPGTLAREVTLDRGDEGLTREPVTAVLAHLFVHQIHHRGQAHAMLSGTRVAPPQLDEFFLEYDRERRAGDEIA
ncbi:MAG TPA: DinB family protein [Myxococcota bacterium]|nr:DinB family protein [Myxococcota bacterium]